MGAKYCDELISLSVLSHISKTTWLIFTNFWACCLCPWLGLRLWPRCYMSCTSSFVDDIEFLHNGHDMARGEFL